MQDCGRLSRHFWLSQGMARTIGVNVNVALRTGRLTRQEYTQAVATCCACGRDRLCTAWMARQGGGAEALPDYCRIKEVLEALRS